MVVLSQYESTSDLLWNRVAVLIPPVAGAPHKGRPEVTCIDVGAFDPEALRVLLCLVPMHENAFLAMRVQARA